MDTERPDELMREGLLELGLTPLSEHINAFLTYLSELKKWNKVYNLTGIEKNKDIVIKHFLDSLLYLKAIPEGKQVIADIGSGAGFPGIPVKIIRPEVEMFLIEPSMKKSAFLINIIKKLAIRKIRVIEKRIEDVRVGREIPLLVDIAMTRALFGIKEFIKKAAHISRPGGLLLLNKGPKVKDELELLKDTEYEIFNALLPLTHIKRFIVSIKLNPAE